MCPGHYLFTYLLASIKKEGKDRVALDPARDQLIKHQHSRQRRGLYLAPGFNRVGQEKVNQPRPAVMFRIMSANLTLSSDCYLRRCPKRI